MPHESISYPFIESIQSFSLSFWISISTCAILTAIVIITMKVLIEKEDQKNIKFSQEVEDGQGLSEERKESE